MENEFSSTVALVSDINSRHQYRTFVTRFCYTVGKNLKLVSCVIILLYNFYRTIHLVLARYCYRKSSVRPSVTFMCCGHRLD